MHVGPDLGSRHENQSRRNMGIPEFTDDLQVVARIHAFFLSICLAAPAVISSFLQPLQRIGVGINTSISSTRLQGIQIRPIKGTWRLLDTNAMLRWSLDSWPTGRGARLQLGGNCTE